MYGPLSIYRYIDNWLHSTLPVSINWCKYGNRTVNYLKKKLMKRPGQTCRRRQTRWRRMRQKLAFMLWQNMNANQRPHQFWHILPVFHYIIYDTNVKGIIVIWTLEPSYITIDTTLVAIGIIPFAIDKIRHQITPLKMTHIDTKNKTVYRLIIACDYNETTKNVLWFWMFWFSIHCVDR